MKLLHFFVASVLFLSLACMSFAEDISISASIDRKSISVGDGAIFTIYVEGAQFMEPPKLPDIEGFRVQYLGPSTQISIVNGQSTVKTAFRYSMIATKAGQYTIQPIELDYQGKTYRTNTVPLTVAASSDEESSRAMTKDDIKKHIYLTVSTKRKTAYLNEGVPLLIRLYIRIGMDVQDIRYPTFPSAGFSVLSFDKPVQQQTVIDGSRFGIIDFETTVYPVTCGELALGPAELNCRLAIRSSRSQNTLFDRPSTYLLTARSDPYNITVLPLPTAGQPKSFTGGVGQYTFAVVAKPTSLKVGEPITLNMAVKGKGNIDVVKMPEISGLDQFKVYDPQIDTRKQGNSGLKTFEQVLIPKSDSVKAIPEIRFTTFDPESGRYVTQTEGPIPLQVEPSDSSEPLQILEMAEGKAVKREVLGRDIVYIKDEIGPIKHGNGGLYKSKGFLALQFIPLFGFAGLMVYQKRRDRFATDRKYARQYHAPKKASKGLAQARKLMESGHAQEFCSAIFKTMQEYLGNRFDLPSSGITTDVVNTLRSRGISADILVKLGDFFQACDRIRFAGSDVNQQEMSAMLDLATESIESLEKRKVAA